MIASQMSICTSKCSLFSDGSKSRFGNRIAIRLPFGAFVWKTEIFGSTLPPYSFFFNFGFLEGFRRRRNLVQTA